MADALKTFREGEDILASETNDNNQYLLSKLSDNAAQVQQYVEGEVATIKSNVASVQATLQNNIDELDAKKPIYVVESGSNENGSFRIWSDGFKQQWGEYNASSNDVTVTVPKQFNTTNYFVTAQFSVTAGAKFEGGDTYTWGGPAVINRTTATFVVHGRASWHGIWYACGF